MMLLNIRKRSLPGLENEKGSVLLTTYLLITVLLLLGTAFVIISTNEGRVSESHRKIAQAFYIAEAGIERMLYDLKKDFEADENWTDGEINGWTYNSAAAVNGYFPFPNASDSDNDSYPSTVLNGGSYSVSLKSGSSTDDIWVRSTGTIGSVSQTILVYVRIVSLSPWDNAIFGGAGSAGGWVNGNVNVSGSVHILGTEDKNANGVLDSGEDINGNEVLDTLGTGQNAITLGGDADLVRNNYGGLDAALEALIPALPITKVNGEDVETLNAELRVKHGRVSLSGSSTIGEPDEYDDDDDEKEMVDGAYVTDGYAGNQGAVNVHSDNGTSEAYDLGDAVNFPSLSDPYPDNPSQDFYEYFAANALVLTTELADISPGVGNGFTHGDCSPNCIIMDDDGNMEVHGIIYVSEGNDLMMSGADITYTGTGSILVTGNAVIDANLRVANTAGKNSYPGNILGLMTPNDISIGVGSQTDVMGLFFAEGTVTTDKQTDLIGSIVANLFNIGQQVPKIYQVPQTADNLPPGMIAGDPVYLLKVVSWQKADNPS